MTSWPGRATYNGVIICESTKPLPTEAEMKAQREASARAWKASKDWLSEEQKAVAAWLQSLEGDDIKEMVERALNLTEMASYD